MTQNDLLKKLQDLHEEKIKLLNDIHNEMMTGCKDVLGIINNRSMFDVLNGMRLIVICQQRLIEITKEIDTIYSEIFSPEKNYGKELQQ